MSSNGKNNESLKNISTIWSERGHIKYKQRGIKKAFCDKLQIQKIEKYKLVAARRQMV